MDLPDNDIIKYFKKFDNDFNGQISKKEVIDAFDQVGIDIEKDIEEIMWNLDNDHKGYLEFSELKIVLTDWNKEIKHKNLCKIFAIENKFIVLNSLKTELSHVKEDEWNEFSKIVEMHDGLVHIDKFKNYIKNQIE